MNSEKNSQLCDIIIPVWNQLNYTRECIASIYKFTTFPFRLILVDNGSDQATAQYLDSVREKNPEQVILIRNAQNLGFIKATNQGIRQSSAPYLCLLNNDTQVTGGWLREMVKVAQSQESIGIVNPNSNTLGCKPKNTQTIEALARELKSYSGQYSNLAWASGFCMLIKRQVIKAIGLLDEIYGMGTFEDSEFSKRAQKLGYLCVCAKAAYVYHREGRSFSKFKQFDKDFNRNRQIFHARWGKPQRLLYVITKDRPDYTDRIYAEAIKLARNGSGIWIFLKNMERLKEHFNVYIYNLPAAFFNLVSFWRILKRKKKFDKIYVDDKVYAKRLEMFKIFHKAEVIYAQ